MTAGGDASGSLSPPGAPAALAEYDIGQFLAAETLPAGGPANRKVSTSAGTFLAPQRRPAGQPLTARRH